MASETDMIIERQFGKVKKGKNDVNNPFITITQFGRFSKKQHQNSLLLSNQLMKIPDL